MLTVAAPAVGSVPAAAPSVSLSALSGPPTSTVTVSGAGFGAYEAVDVSFDTTGVALGSTSDSGAFSGITVGVPASVAPGTTHYITGVGRRSGLSAQTSLLVFAGWPQAGDLADNTGVNPYEDVLSPDTVPSMGEDWAFSLGDAAARRPRWPTGRSTSAPPIATSMPWTRPPAQRCGASPPETGFSRRPR